MQFIIPAAIGFTFHYWVLIIAAALFLFARFAYLKTTPPVPGFWKAVLVSLRMGAFLVIVFLLFDPRCIREGEQTEPANVIALVDRSASMSLPREGWESVSPGSSRFDAAVNIADSFRKSVESRGGVYREVFFSSGELESSQDSIAPDGQGTNVMQALMSAYEKYEGENVSALVLISDGMETDKSLIRRELPPVPVFTVGVGDTASPDDVRIRDVAYSSVVRTPSRSKIAVSLYYSGDRRKQVRLLLRENNAVVFEKDTVMSAAMREITQDIDVRFPEAGRRHFTLDVEVDGDDAEPDNNRRDIVIEAEKAEAKILIVDLRPDWELHFLTGLLRGDESFDYEVISSERMVAPPQGRFIAQQRFSERLAESDALVLLSVTEDFLDEKNSAVIERFVRERGGGVLVMPGPASLYSQANAWRRLEDLLPVSGSPPFHFRLQYTGLAAGAQAGTNPITSRLLPLFGQKEWQERSPLLGYYSPLTVKAGAEVLLDIRGGNVPAVCYQTVGKGRVATVSAGPLWRWKFLSDGGSVYDELMSRMLDVLSRGEETERFFLTAKKNVFDAGEEPVFYAEVFNEKMQPITGVPVKIEVSKLEADGEEVPLQRISMARENVQSTRFHATVKPLPPGRYLARGEAELPSKSVESRPVEFEISSVSVEFQDVRQDRTALAGIALHSGGAYGEEKDVASLTARIPLDTKKIATVREMSVRTSAVAFIIILLLLSAEWIIRKRLGMI